LKENAECETSIRIGHNTKVILFMHVHGKVLKLTIIGQNCNDDIYDHH
jgi:hypothetical protein